MDKSEKKTPEITFYDLLYIVIKEKKTVLSITIVSMIGAVLIAIFSTPVYRSEALLSASDNISISGGGLSGLGSLSGLSSLTGISIGGNDKLNEFIEIVKSREFTEALILDEGIIHYLYEDQWDFTTNDWKKGEDTFFSSLRKWVQKMLAKVSGDQGYGNKMRGVDNVDNYSGPSLEKAVKKFDTIRKITLDRKTNFIKISIESKYPSLAKKWIEILVKRLNERVRNESKQEAENSIKYLRFKLETETNKNIVSTISQLIEQQMKNNMLANIRDDYALKYINRPSVPEQRIRPKRKVIVILGILMGVFFGIVIVFLKNSLGFYIRSYKERYG